MKLSEWKPFMLGWIDEVQTEAGIQVPVLSDLRRRIEEADASVAATRELLERELFGFVDSQAFLRQAAARYMERRATEAIEQAAAVLKRAEAYLPAEHRLTRETKRDREDVTAHHEPADLKPLDVIDVREAIRRAEEILPGQVAPDGERDPRWQAIMRIEDFIEEEPDAIWPFILRWGTSDDEDLRTAIGVLLLEHLLAHDFTRFFPLVEDSIRKNAQFGDTFSRCWKMGQAKNPENSDRFDALQLEYKNARRSK